MRTRIKKVMARNVTIVIEITDTHLKCVQRENFVISHSVIRPVNSDAQIIEGLRTVFASRQIKGDDVIILIPRRHVILKHLNFPTHSETEIRKMLGLQISQHFPYSSENIVFDFTVLQKDPGGYTKILVFAIPKTIIFRYLDCVNQAGGHPQQVVISSLGLAACYGTHGKLQNTEAEIFLDIDADHSEIGFYRDQFLFSRSIALGSRDLNEDKVTALVEQVGLTLSAFNKEKLAEKISRVIISTHPLAESLRLSIEKYYQLPVEISDCTKNFTFTPGLQREGMKEVSLAACLGVLAKDFHNPVNLTPEEMISAKRSRRQKSLLAKSIILSVLIFIALLEIFGASMASKSLYLNRLEKQISQDRAARDLAEKRIRFLKAIKEEGLNRIFFPDVIQRLYEITPPEITLRTIEMNGARVLTIEGIADSSARVNQLQNNFLNSALFKQVTLLYATKRKRFQQEYIDFKISCQIAIAAENSNVR